MSVKITFSQSGWTSTLTALYLDTSTGKCYSDSACTTEIDSVPKPTRTSTTATSGYKFLGYYSTNATTGTQYIDTDGSILDTLRDLTAAKTIYCPSVIHSYRITLHDYNGTGGDGSFWRIKTATTSDYFFREEECVTPVSKVTAPTRDGYSFAGYYNGTTTPGTQYVDESGNILAALSALTAAVKTIYAKWTARTYTLAFDYNGGTGATTSMQVTYGSAIGTLPTATYNALADFVQWNLNGSQITATTVWSIAGDASAVAQWDYYFGRTTDFFEAEDELLMLVASESGDSRLVSETAGSTGSDSSLKVGCLAIQSSDSAKAAFWKGGLLKNPTCTYRIKGEGNVSFQLGKAWNGTNGKFFLTGIEYQTGADREPLLVLKGTANEGANAINLWTVQFAISPEHVAQDPYGAISGGGELTECTTSVSANPVVLYENGAPCASDIVHGKITVRANTDAFFGESAPTANSSASFVETNGAPSTMSDADFTSYKIVTERSL